MSDSFVNMAQQLIDAARKNNTTAGLIRPSNHLLCLKFYDEGWRHEGFEYIPDSTSIIVFWIKDNQRQSIILSFEEQQLWVRELDRRRAEGAK